MLTGFNHSSGAEGTLIRYSGRCGNAKIERALQASAPRKQLIWYFRQFETFERLTRDISFARVGASGAPPRNNPKDLTGYIVIDAPDGDDKAWWDQSEKLIEHVTRVMSLARGTYLRPPIERRVQGTMDILKVSEVEMGEKPFLAPFQYTNLQSIFDCACDSYAELSTVMKSLDPAIQWLLAPASYDEIRLITAMTALENIVEGAYPEKTTRIASRRTFDKFAKAVRSLITTHGFPEGLQAKLPELNRPYLLEKLDRYIRDHEIKINDFAQNSLKKLIGARNGIVHQGIYFKDTDPNQMDLWEHILIARELVLRILLKALKFQGSYSSALHEGKQLAFPSCRSLD